jgi:polygalacturonase
MIRIANCANCSITGPAVLNGQSDLWVEGHYKHRERKKVKNWADPTCIHREECRPRLLGILDCNGVDIYNISLLNPIYWGLHIINSHNIQVGPDFTLQGDREVPNNDGIDIDSSSNITVTGCTIDTADDAICIKTKLINTPCHDIFIHNCTLQSKSSALKIGSESVSDIFNVTFDNITITRATRAMAIQQRDNRPGGSVYNITFSNIIVDKVRYPPDTSWWGAGEVISLSLLPRAPDPSTGMVEMPGSMHNVYFRNITAYSSDTGVVVVGNLEDEEQVYGTTRIKNIHIEGLLLFMRRWREEGVGGDYIATNNKNKNKNNDSNRREAYLDLRPSTVGMVPLDGDISHVAVYLEYCQGVKIEGVVVDSDGVYEMDGTTEGIDLHALVMGRTEEG